VAIRSSDLTGAFNLARFLLLILVLASCTPRGQITLAPQAAAVGAVQTVFVGTTRVIDPETGRYGTGRSEVMQFARYDVSIPPDRALGEIKFPRKGGKPNPRLDFLTTAEVLHSSADDFRADIAKAALKGPRGGREAVIFVHGFNTNFSEGVYRIAQLSHDLELPGATVHYSWPSAANPLGYVRDRDSVLFARDGLEALIEQVEAAGADRILLVAHSMGALLTMETIRQIGIRGDASLLHKIAGVILISPDLDVDVFRAQAQDIGVLPQPFLIFGSHRDRLLNLSAVVTGEPDRLGNLKDLTRVADLKVTYLDAGAVDGGASHFAFGNSPILLSLLGRIGEVDAAFQNETRGRVGLLPGVILTVQNATQIVLAPVTAIAYEAGR
jgi:esterase/lipase superfamily enzyme